MIVAQLDPVGITFEYIVRQFGPGVGLVVAMSFGFFYALRAYHTRQIAAFEEAHRAAIGQLELAQRRYQEQLERLAGRFESQLDGLTRRHEDALQGLESRFRESVREQAAMTAGVLKSVESLQAAVADLTVVVGRLADDREILELARITAE